MATPIRLRLTFNDYDPAGAGGETTANLTGFDLNPHWSPEGDRIVFHSGRGIEFGAAQWAAFTIGSTSGEAPITGAPAVRLTARDLNDERCGWSVATPHNLLSVAKAGSGEGTVTSTPPGIDCGDDCAQGFADNTVVTLTAAPAANGSTFVGFTGGGCSGAGLTCDVTVDDAKTVTATFADPAPALIVTKAGSGARKANTGEGTVTSTPTGISCGLDCTEEYAAGTDVTLTATPAAGSTFDGFTGGGCTGTGTTCTVSVDEATTVRAIFSGPLLTVTKAGSGVGTVTSLPFGISCGTDCSEDYTAGTSVTLTATVNASTVAGGPGSTFAGFSGGGCSGTGTTCTVTIDQARDVTGTFVDFPTLTVTKTGTGTGTVTSAPAGLSCGATCTRDFPIDSTVTLTAAAAAGSAFEGFTGCATTPTATTCTVTMDQAKTVTARFIVLRTLTVTKDGTGSGLVTSNPVGINCGDDCTQDYDNGTLVTVSANPAAGSTFAGFSGGGCSGTGTNCQVTMNQAQSVTATFTLIPTVAPPPRPPPPAAVPPPPPPPPPPPAAAAAVARRRANITASVTPARDLTAPFVFRASGRLSLPSGMTRAQGCNGRVSVQIKRGGTTLSTRRVSLTSSCTYSLRVSFGNRRRFGTATRLKFTARFLGNALLFPDTATARFARVRR